MTAEAVALNPNLATAWHSQGWVALMCDEPERAIEAFERLLRLSPLDPLRPWVWNGTAFALFCLGRYVEGCDAANKSLQFRADAHSLVEISTEPFVVAASTTLFRSRPWTSPLVVFALSCTPAGTST